MERLPYIDEHAMDISAPRERVWIALTEVLHRETRGGDGIARALGCDPAHGSLQFDGSPGQTLPGFRVAEAERGRRLALRGRHRFSHYQLTFLLDDGRLRAQTHAAFPGSLGRLYRAAVVGSGGHRIVTRRLLRQVARRA
ncbi:MAG TPA: hypothetical protein VFF79_01610 [Conexibacter sp.]|jgi:hypothetical protein|nr:hypothetical protein [Conexibacter sp.]